MEVLEIVGNVIYVVLALIALWGAYCATMVWSRVAQQRFRTEEQQEEFLEALDDPLQKGDFDSAVELCEGDRRAVCQLALLAISHRRI